MTGDPRRLVRAYLLLVGTGLLLEGAALLVAAAIHLAVPFALDSPHNALHVVWGLLILLGLATSRDPRRLTTLALVFGVFYTTLALVGMSLVNPFGLVLGPGENLFHLMVGLASIAAVLLQARWRGLPAPAGGSGRRR
jgi:hypothetical protein